MENFKIAPSNKTEYDSKGIAPSFESHFKEPKRNFKIASSLEMLQQVLTSGFTNLEVFLKENKIENSKLHHHLLWLNKSKHDSNEFINIKVTR